MRIKSFFVCLVMIACGNVCCMEQPAKTEQDFGDPIPEHVLCPEVMQAALQGQANSPSTSEHVELFLQTMKSIRNSLHDSTQKK